MCDPPAIIEWTNVRILRPGRAPPTRPTRRTVAFTRASNPSRWVSVATSNNPALATRFESSKVTSIRSIACDTRLTGSASWLPDNEGFRHPHRPSPGGLSRGYATRHTHDRSVHRGLAERSGADDNVVDVPCVGRISDPRPAARDVVERGVDALATSRPLLRRRGDAADFDDGTDVVDHVDELRILRLTGDRTHAGRDVEGIVGSVQGRAVESEDVVSGPPRSVRKAHRVVQPIPAVAALGDEDNADRGRARSGNRRGDDRAHIHAQRLADLGPRRNWVEA